jgi:hypothetical protein
MDAFEQGPLPEATASEESGESIDNAKSKDALDGSGDYTKGQRVRMVLFPCLDVEGHKSWVLLARCGSIRDVLRTGKEGEYSFPSLAEVHCGREEQHLQRCVDRVDACNRQQRISVDIGGHF